MSIETLGVDIGGVIIDRKNNDNEPSFFKGNHLKSPEIPGAIAGLEMSRGRFGPLIYLVSKVFSEFETKTREWLSVPERDFERRTGIIVEQRAIFCRDRIEKAEICRKRKITHFVDDRVETMTYLLHCVPNLYLFCGNGNAARHDFGAELPAHVHRVHSWDELQRFLAR